MHEIRPLRSGWSAVALWQGWQSYACLGSAPYADCWIDQSWYKLYDELTTLANFITKNLKLISVLIFYLSLSIHYVLPILYIYFLGVWLSQQATLGDSLTIPYAVLGDCSDHRARFQPLSGTCPLVSTLCSKTVPTTEHVYVPNHAQGLVYQSLRRARGLCRPPSMFTFPTILGDCRSVSMPCSWTVLTTDRARRLINHSLRCARDLLRSLSDHSLGTAFLSYI